MILNRSINTLILNQKQKQAVMYFKNDNNNYSFGKYNKENLIYSLAFIKLENAIKEFPYSTDKIMKSFPDQTILLKIIHKPTNTTTLLPLTKDAVNDICYLDSIKADTKLETLLTKLANILPWQNQFEKSIVNKVEVFC